MKILADTQKCQGHARCSVLAPDWMILNDEGYLDTPEIMVPEGQETLAKRVIRACPEGILKISE
jgi:ferredoxin